MLLAHFPSPAESAQKVMTIHRTSPAALQRHSASLRVVVGTYIPVDSDSYSDVSIVFKVVAGDDMIQYGQSHKIAPVTDRTHGMTIDFLMGNPLPRGEVWLMVIARFNSLDQLGNRYGEHTLRANQTLFVEENSLSLNRVIPRDVHSYSEAIHAEISLGWVPAAEICLGGAIADLDNNATFGRTRAMPVSRTYGTATVTIEATVHPLPPVVRIVAFAAPCANFSFSNRIAHDRVLRHVRTVTHEPTVAPSSAPTTAPTGNPTTPSPTHKPTAVPTPRPTQAPTATPTGVPSADPTSPLRIEITSVTPDVPVVDDRRPIVVQVALTGTISEALVIGALFKLTGGGTVAKRNRVTVAAGEREIRFSLDYHRALVQGHYTLIVFTAPALSAQLATFQNRLAQDSKEMRVMTLAPTDVPTQSPTSTPTVSPCTPNLCRNGGICIVVPAISGFAAAAALWDIIDNDGGGSGVEEDDDASGVEPGGRRWECMCATGFLGLRCETTMRPTAAPICTPSTSPTLQPSVMPTRLVTVSPTPQPTLATTGPRPTPLPTPLPTATLRIEVLGTSPAFLTAGLTELEIQVAVSGPVPSGGVSLGALLRRAGDGALIGKRSKAASLDDAGTAWYIISLKRALVPGTVILSVYASPMRSPNSKNRLAFRDEPLTVQATAPTTTATLQATSRSTEGATSASLDVLQIEMAIVPSPGLTIGQMTMTVEVTVRGPVLEVLSIGGILRRADDRSLIGKKPKAVSVETEGAVRFSIDFQAALSHGSVVLTVYASPLTSPAFRNRLASNQLLLDVSGAVDQASEATVSSDDLHIEIVGTSPSKLTVDDTSVTLQVAVRGRLPGTLTMGATVRRADDNTLVGKRSKVASLSEEGTVEFTVDFTKADLNQGFVLLTVYASPIGNPSFKTRVVDHVESLEVASPAATQPDEPAAEALIPLEIQLVSMAPSQLRVDQRAYVVSVGIVLDGGGPTGLVVGAKIKGLDGTLYAKVVKINLVEGDAVTSFQMQFRSAPSEGQLKLEVFVSPSNNPAYGARLADIEDIIVVGPAQQSRRQNGLFSLGGGLFAPPADEPLGIVGVRSESLVLGQSLMRVEVAVTGNVPINPISIAAIVQSDSDSNSAGSSRVVDLQEGVTSVILSIPLDSHLITPGSYTVVMFVVPTATPSWAFRLANASMPRTVMAPPSVGPPTAAPSIEPAELRLTDIYPTELELGMTVITVGIGLITGPNGAYSASGTLTQNGVLIARMSTTTVWPGAGYSWASISVSSALEPCIDAQLRVFVAPIATPGFRYLITSVDHVFPVECPPTVSAPTSSPTSAPTINPAGSTLRVAISSVSPPRLLAGVDQSIVVEVAVTGIRPGDLALGAFLRKTDGGGVFGKRTRINILPDKRSVQFTIDLNRELVEDNFTLTVFVTPADSAAFRNRLSQDSKYMTAVTLAPSEVPTETPTSPSPTALPTVVPTVSPCDPDPCTNGGVCSPRFSALDLATLGDFDDNSGSGDMRWWECHCPDGFLGERCQDTASPTAVPTVSPTVPLVIELALSSQEKLLVGTSLIGFDVTLSGSIPKARRLTATLRRGALIFGQLSKFSMEEGVTTGHFELGLVEALTAGQVMLVVVVHGEEGTVSLRDDVELIFDSVEVVTEQLSRADRVMAIEMAISTGLPSGYFGHNMQCVQVSSFDEIYGQSCIQPNHFPTGNISVVNMIVDVDFSRLPAHATSVELGVYSLSLDALPALEDGIVGAHARAQDATEPDVAYGEAPFIWTEGTWFPGHRTVWTMVSVDTDAVPVAPQAPIQILGNLPTHPTPDDTLTFMVVKYNFTAVAAVFGIQCRTRFSMASLRSDRMAVDGSATLSKVEGKGSAVFNNCAGTASIPLELTQPLLVGDMSVMVRVTVDLVDQGADPAAAAAVVFAPYVSLVRHTVVIEIVPEDGHRVVVEMMSPPVLGSEQDSVTVTFGYVAETCAPFTCAVRVLVSFEDGQKFTARSDPLTLKTGRGHAEVIFPPSTILPIGAGVVQTSLVVADGDRKGTILYQDAGVVLVEMLPKPLCAPTATEDTLPAAKNVLFLSVDDLGPQVSSFGYFKAMTPNIDKLGAEGTRFHNHYVDSPVCIPSRVAMLTGVRSMTSKQGFEQHHFRNNPSIGTMPEAFEAAGYSTYGYGKVYHYKNETKGFSMVFDGDKSKKYINPELNAASRYDRPLYNFDESNDDDHTDGLIRLLAVDTIKIHRLNRLPFWLGCGFNKPHTPYVAPQKYWDMYDGVNFDVPPMQFPEGVPKIPAHNKWSDLTNYAEFVATADIYNTTMSVAMAKNVTRAYAAAVTFVDTQIGNVVDALGCLRGNTIIILWGDHGYHLGEQNQWAKNSLFEQAIRSPLIVVDPDAITAASRKNVYALVESVDIFPTILELCRVQYHALLEGTSFAPLLRDASLELDWKTAAFTVKFLPRGTHFYIGHSVRTERYRFTEWMYISKEQKDKLPDLWVVTLEAGILGYTRPPVRELFDYVVDRDGQRNLVADPSYKLVVLKLANVIREGFPAVAAQIGRGSTVPLQDESASAGSL